jgi:two-component system, NarL family, nitrate/nitrite response regulator NarL
VKSPANAAKIQILLIDDHTLFREGLVRLLESEPDFELAAQCSSVKEAFEVLAAKPVDVVLLDYDLGKEKGSEFFRLAPPGTNLGRTLILTGGMTDLELKHMLALGASGIFLKHDSPTLLAKGIREVHAGRSWMDQSMSQQLAKLDMSSERDSRSKALSQRERQILRYLLEGLSNKEIAGNLDISESGVKAILQQLFNKTGVRTRSQLVRIALEEYRDQL